MLEFARGEWWRFERYEIRDDYIRPATGARLERYDPWKTYREELRGLKRPNQPYVALDDVLSGNPFDPLRESPHIALSVETETRITDWCSRYGLLGILLQRVSRIAFPPRRGPSALPSGPGTPQAEVSRIDMFDRIGAGWQLGVIEGPMGASSNTEPNWVLPLAPILAPQPGVVLRDLVRERVYIGRVEDEWGAFFPNVPPEIRSTHRYPEPLSDSFWEEYAEPVTEFVRTASRLRHAVRGCLSRGAASSSGSIPGDSDEANAARFEALQKGILPTEGLRLLLAFLDPVRPGVERDAQGSLQPCWECGTLLESLALMIYLDIAGGRVRQCEECKTIFLNQGHEAKYCSKPCLWRVQKRKQRASADSTRG